MLSGIPQGSVPGPLLFVLYVNELPENINFETFLFADDTKIFREITSREDSVALQNDIDSLELWTKKWLLEFNMPRFDLGKFENIKHTHRYTISKNEFEHVFGEKDFRVT